MSERPARRLPTLRAAGLALVNRAPRATIAVSTRLVGVAKWAARFFPDPAPDPLRYRHNEIGRAVPRLDGPAKVVGAARFSAEAPIDGLAYAALAYSTIARGTITHLDTTAADRAPGVLAVLSYQNAPPMANPPKPPPASSGLSPRGTAASDLPVLDARVAWNGQPVAVVVAETLEQAEHAASLLRVDYTAERALVGFAAAVKTVAVAPVDVVGDPARITIGDAERRLRTSEVVVDRRYTTPRHNHNALEPHATIADWDEDGRLTLWDSTQYLYGVRDTIAAVFSLEPADVRVIAHHVGGSFGSKGNVWNNTVLCAAAAKVVGRPVQLALSRRGVYHVVGGRATTQQRVALGADDRGKLTAVIHTGVSSTTASGEFAEPFGHPASHMYAAETVLVDHQVVHLDTVTNTSMRGPGPSVGSFALETAIDELAHELRIDPIELRRRNEPDRDPSTGRPFSSRHFLEACDRGAERFGWSVHAPRSRRDGRWLLGSGVAAANYHVVRFPAAVRVRLHVDGTAVVQTSAQDNGMGTGTVQTQHAAERLALPIDNVVFEYGDSALPKSAPAGASNQTVALLQAVTQAVRALHEDLLTLVKQAEGRGYTGPLAGARIEDVEARGGGLFRTDDPASGETYWAILQMAGRAAAQAETTSRLPFETMKYSMHSYGMHFCDVRVDEDTGETRVTRWLGSFDCGRIINEQLAISQFRGGIIMGIGAALTEETLFDERSGRIMNPSLAEYHVPVHLDVPPIDIIYTDIPDPHTAVGAHGIGEIGIVGAAAAIGNAVFNATGTRVRDLPITLDKLL